MNTIRLNVLGEAKAASSGVSIKNQDKSVEITENGVTELTADSGYTGLGKVTINANVQGGAVAVSVNAVNFRDYDGAILHSYTKDEFLALTELPPLPTREGLICQEWNWDFADAVEYVTEYGVLEVGATYITDDGKTRLYITIAAEGRMDVPLYFQQTIANGVTIDWGDGSATETLSGTGRVNTTHHYNTIGDYVISLDVVDGCTLGFGHNSASYCVMGSTGSNIVVYRSMLQRVEIGKGVTQLQSSSFDRCGGLKSITIPNNVVFQNSSIFGSCGSLSSIVIPRAVTNIPYQTFSTCYALSSVCIPKEVTTLNTYAFSGCYSLSSVCIPNGVTSIGYGAFNGCYIICSAIIPQGVQSIEQDAFRQCRSLISVSISQGVKSIGKGAFYYCQSLSSVVIPQGVTSIGDDAFNCCYSMAFYDFSALEAVPSLNATSAFYSIPSDCKIIVPDALYDTWIAATNWSTYASYIIKKSEWDALNA